MLRLEWSGPALRDLQAAGDYIAQEAPQTAKRMSKRVREAVEILQAHPNMGRPGRVAETRELVVSGTQFVVIYRARRGIIQVLRLLHHARRWPE